MRRPHGHGRRVASELSRDQRELVRVIGIPLEGVGPKAASEPSPASVVIACGLSRLRRGYDNNIRKFLYSRLALDDHLAFRDKGVRRLLYESRRQPRSRDSRSGPNIWCFGDASDAYSRRYRYSRYSVRGFLDLGNTRYPQYLLALEEEEEERGVHLSIHPAIHRFLLGLPR
jgi:hypothetical protein